MRAAVVAATATSTRRSRAVAAQPSMAGRALVARRLDAGAVRLRRRRATCGVAVVDYGAKRSILRRLAGAGAAVTVFPHDVDADDARRATTACCSRTARATRSRSSSEVDDRARAARPRARSSASASATSCSRSRPGHETFKLPFGHRGANHPVLERATGRVLVTSQNHGFAVAPTDDARGDARLALRRHRRGPRLPGAARALGAVPPRGRPGPARRAGRSSTSWVEEVRLAAGVTTSSRSA